MPPRSIARASHRTTSSCVAIPPRSIAPRTTSHDIVVRCHAAAFHRPRITSHDIVVRCHATAFHRPRTTSHDIVVRCHVAAFHRPAVCAGGPKHSRTGIAPTHDSVARMLRPYNIGASPSGIRAATPSFAHHGGSYLDPLNGHFAETGRRCA
jgi:hypothetical protein